MRRKFGWLGSIVTPEVVQYVQDAINGRRSDIWNHLGRDVFSSGLGGFPGPTLGERPKGKMWNHGSHGVLQCAKDKRTPDQEAWIQCVEHHSAGKVSVPDPPHP
jgi:hypothetical protein